MIFHLEKKRKSHKSTGFDVKNKKTLCANKILAL